MPVVSGPCGCLALQQGPRRSAQPFEAGTDQSCQKPGMMSFRSIEDWLHAALAHLVTRREGCLQVPVRVRTSVGH